MARKRKSPEATSDSSSSSRPKSNKKKRPGCLMTLAGFLLVLVILIFVAPIMLSQGTLLQQAVSWSLPEFQGSVTIDSASLNWFSPIRLEQVNVIDAAGSPLAAIKTIESEAPLYAIVTNYRRPGELRVIEPRLHFDLRDDGSNWEDALASWIGTDSVKGRERIETYIVVQDGAAEILDRVTSERWVVSDLDLTINIPRAEPILARLKGAAGTSENSHSGRFEGELSWSGRQADSDRLGEGRLVLDSRQLPLGMFQPVLRRISSGAELSGALGTKLEISWSANGLHQIARISNLDVTNLDLAAPELIGGDRLQLPLVTASGEVELSGAQLQVRDFQLESDIVKLDATGIVDRNQLTDDATTAGLIDQDYRIAGEADLARLAAMFPQTLRIREGTQVTSGRVSLSLKSLQVSDERRWIGKVDASQLEANANGRVLRWNQPIQVDIAAVKSAAGLNIERLECKSSFVELTAVASRDSGTVYADVDLDQLVAELTQFVDLRDMAIAGQLAGKMEWQSDETGKVAALLDARVVNFELSRSTRRPWREQQLVITGSATLTGNTSQQRRLESAELQVSAGKDRLHAQLTEQVLIAAGTGYPVQCNVTGNLATWLPRVQFQMLPGWQIDGNLELVAAGNVSAERLEIISNHTSVKQFRATGGGIRIDEPEIVAEAILQCDFGDRQLTTRKFTVTSSTISMRSDNLAAEFPPSEFRVGGDIAFRGDIGRLMSWTYDAHDPPSTHMFGMTVGLVHLSHEDGKTLFRGTTDVDQLVVARRLENRGSAIVSTSTGSTPWQTVWNENKVQLQGEGSFNHSNGSIQLASLDVRTDAFRVAAQGEASDLAGGCRVDVNGQISYDLEMLTARLLPYLGRNIQLSGRDSRSFQLHGPLKGTDPIAADSNVTTSSLPASIPKELEASASVGWTSVNAHGFTVGEGELLGTLSRGVLKFQPLDLVASEGRIRFTPTLNLAAHPATIQLDPRARAERLRLSPEMCRSWLKYVAPLLADATQAEGQLSIDVTHCRLPVTDLTGGDVQARLTVHEAQVGPGAAGKQLIALADQVISLVRQSSDRPSEISSRWVLMPEQTVAMQMSNRRVHHKNLQLVVGDVTITTSGSVGVDQTIALVAEIPIRDDWVAGSRYLSGLAGQTLKIPIEGTLSKPRIDDRVLANLTRQAIGGSVEKLLQDEVIKGLDSLFGPQR